MNGHGKTPGVDRLADELNASPSVEGQSLARLAEWLIALRGRGSSDLYLVAGLPPSIRVDGIIQHLPERPLEGQEIEDAVLPALPPHAVDSYHAAGHADSSLRRGSAKDDFGSAALQFTQTS
jgi:Tfp pilus assembly ATPase PilU